MKRHFNILITLVMLVGILAINARAQTASSQRLTANIPFAFNVGDKTLPAGRKSLITDVKCKRDVCSQSLTACRLCTRVDSQYSDQHNESYQNVEMSFHNGPPSFTHAHVWSGFPHDRETFVVNSAVTPRIIYAAA